MTGLVLLPWHLGGLHPIEQVLVFAIAFGPFLVLAVVVHVVRKRDLAHEQHSSGGGAPSE